MIDTNTFVAALAILVIGYIIYKSFFADKETVLETINETKKEVEEVPAAVIQQGAHSVAKVEEEVKEVAKKTVRKTKVAAAKIAVAVATKGKTTRAKKNG